MKKSAKSLMATLLTLVMVLSSFAIFAISGGAKTEATITKIEEWKVEKLANGYVLDNSQGSSVTWQDLIDYQANPVGQRFGLAFTAEALAADVAYELRIRNSNNGAGSKCYTSLLKFKADGNIVVGLEETTVLATYTAEQPVDIYLDVYAEWPDTEADYKGSKVIVDYYIGGDLVYTFEKEGCVGMPSNFGYVQFSSSATTTESKQLKITDITLYDIPVVSDGGATEFTDLQATPELEIEAVENGYLMSKNGGNSSLTLKNLIDYANNPKEQRFGLSFTVEAAAADSLKHELRIRNSNNGATGSKCYTSLLKFKDTGDIVVGLDESKVLTQYTAEQPIDIYLDVYAKWPDTDADYKGSTIFVDYYIDGDLVYAFQKDGCMGLPSNFGYIQLTGTGKLTITDIKAYNGLRSNSFICPGASMRLTDDAASSGLRFTYGVNKAWFANQAGATVGALIIPTDKLPNGFSAEALADLVKDVDYVEMTDIGFAENAPEADEKTGIYYASLVDLKEENYARAFTGVGFVELANGERIYTRAQSYSIYDVAAKASASGIYEETENETLIDGYLDKVVSLKSELGVPQMVEVANYESSYELTADEAGFTLSGDVENITAIILDGVVYTTGWDIADGVLTVTFATEE